MIFQERRLQYFPKLCCFTLVFLMESMKVEREQMRSGIRETQSKNYSSNSIVDLLVHQESCKRLQLTGPCIVDYHSTNGIQLYVRGRADGKTATTADCQATLIKFFQDVFLHFGENQIEGGSSMYGYRAYSHMVLQLQPEAQRVTCQHHNDIKVKQASLTMKQIKVSKNEMY